MQPTRRTFLTAASGLALGTRLAAASTPGANDRLPSASSAPAAARTG